MEMVIPEQLLEMFIEFLEYRHRVKIETKYTIKGEYGRCFDGIRLLIIREGTETVFGKTYTLFSPDTDFVTKVDNDFTRLVNEAQQQEQKEQVDEQQQRDD